MRSGHRNACSERRRTAPGRFGSDRRRPASASSRRDQPAWAASPGARPWCRAFAIQPVVGLYRPPEPVTTAEQTHLAHHTGQPIPSRARLGRTRSPSSTAILGSPDTRDLPLSLQTPDCACSQAALARFGAGSRREVHRGKRYHQGAEGSARNWWKTVEAIIIGLVTIATIFTLMQAGRPRCMHQLGSESRCWMQLIAPGDRRAVGLTRDHDDHRLRRLRRGPAPA